jgi:hypothetical protein
VFGRGIGRVLAVDEELDTVRDFVDPATQGISDNEYFEANKQNAVGLPGSTVAAAR